MFAGLPASSAMAAPATSGFSCRPPDLDDILALNTTK